MIGLALWGAAGACVLMFLLWLIHLATGNAAIVDFGWALGLAMLGIGYAAAGHGSPLRSSLMAMMSGIWGTRLAMYLLLTRVIGHPEEGRYQELRRKWKTHLPLKFLVFFEFQALLDVVLAMPFLVVAANQDGRLSWFEWLGATLWVIAFFGELTSDTQLARFKSRPENKGRTCQAGLWHYSRHPNYFFEWLIWMSFAIFALGSRYGWTGLLSPALILYFLLRVTGIPATEEQAVRSRGEEYRNYQRTTSAFVPWFKKA